MSIPSNDKVAALSMKIAHEVYSGGCIDCGAHGVEMHEVLGRVMRHTLGAVPCILGVTLAPLCQKCHKYWVELTIGQQLKKLQYELFINNQLKEAQRDHLIALKARVHKA